MKIEYEDGKYVREIKARFYKPNNSLFKKYDLFTLINKYDQEPVSVDLGNMIKPTKPGIKLKYNGKEYLTDVIYQGYGDSILFFEDKNNVGDGYVVNSSGQIYGPFDANKSIKISRTDRIRVVDKEGYIIYLDDQLSPTKTNFIEIDENTYKDVTTNKYGVMKDGRIITPALSSTPNISWASTRSNHEVNCYVLENGMLYAIGYDATNKPHVRYEMEYPGKEAPRGTTLFLGCELLFEGNKRYIVNDCDHFDRRGKVIYAIEGDYFVESKVDYDSGIVVFNHKSGEKAICLTIDSTGITNVVEIDGKVKDIKQDVLAVVKSDGKCGLMNTKGEQLMPFEYDGFTLDTENNSQIFIGLTKEDKIGLYNCCDKYMALPVEYTDIVLDQPESVDKYVKNSSYDDNEYHSDNLYRFFVQFKKGGAYGIVNSKNHVVLGPILAYNRNWKHFSYEGNYSYECFELYKDRILPGEIDICLENPILFPKNKRVSSTREVKETKRVPKYSHSEINSAMFGNIVYTSWLRAGMRTETKTVTTTKLETEYHRGSYKVPKVILDVLDLDLKDISKDLLPLKLRVDSDAIKEAKEELDKSKASAQESIEGANDVLYVATNDENEHNENINDDPNNRR